MNAQELKNAINDAINDQDGEDTNQIMIEVVDLEMNDYEISKNYNTVQVIINNKIAYFQIDSDEYGEKEWVANALRNLRGFQKQDKELIEKEEKTIVWMDQQEALSIHKLKDDELKDRIALYGIKLKKAV